MIDSGATPRLVELLQREDCPKLQFEATLVLTSITRGGPGNTTAVVEADAVPHFVKLIGSPDDNVSEQALLVLGYIIDDSVLYRDIVLQHGALPAILRVGEVRATDFLSFLD